MRISVIISTFSIDRVELVKNSIRSLLVQTLKPDEILLVLDSDKELLQFYKSNISDGVKIIDSETTGLSNARNVGIKYAQGEVVAFIDDDAEADSHWIETILENFKKEDVLVVGGIVKPLWPDKRPIWFPEELNWIIGCTYKGHPENLGFIRNPIGCNMSFKKDVFKKIGYFRSDIGRYGKKLMDAEEVEISMRIIKNFPNSKILYDPANIVYHHVSENRVKLSYIIKRSYYQGISKAILSNFYSYKSFSSEKNYIRYIFKSSIINRIKNIHRLENISQLLVLFLSISCVIIGFFKERILKSSI